MGFFKRRRALKHLKLLVRHARHVRNLREDVASSDMIRRMTESEQKAREAIRTGDNETMQSSGVQLEKSIRAMLPRRSFPGIRDNMEMIIVAIAVAMAFRTYFVQPFKIPTSSMSPTLCGITFQPGRTPSVFDRIPLRLVKWVILGQWHTEVNARSFGTVEFQEGPQGEPVISVNGIPHIVNKDMRIYVAAGDRVVRGQPLASGIRTAGDHILVNKMIWHFRRPKRGEIMVFRTDGIEHPQIKQNEHYVKRLVGLPNEKLAIQEPYLKIDGQRLTEPENIRRIEEDRQAGYVGFRRVGILEDSKEVELGPDDFYACGDNQASSLDSRYWGPVPRKNLVGPAFFIYWPFSSRWGPVD